MENLFYLIFLFFVYLIIFSALFFESLPFIGTIVPGGLILVFFVGFFSKIGFLNPFLSFTICVLAFFLADLVGFHLGMKKGEKVITKCSKYFFLKEEFLHKIANKISNHPKKSLFFGKLNPLVRCFLPFFHGMKKTNKKYFLILSLISNLLVVSTFFFFGYFIGKGVKTIKFLFEAVFLLTAIVFLISYLYYLRGLKKDVHHKQVKS